MVRAIAVSAMGTVRERSSDATIHTPVELRGDRTSRFGMTVASFTLREVSALVTPGESAPHGPLTWLTAGAEDRDRRPGLSSSCS
jgi:hypothetical protein